MLWNLMQKDDDTTIEINPEELMKFIMKESLFLESMDKLLEESMSMKSILTGKTFFMLSEFFGKYISHFLENMMYFMPKEVQG